ncbi:hypothetical protein ACSS31_26845 (plasmid) [Priestia megaterium]
MKPVIKFEGYTIDKLYIERLEVSHDDQKPKENNLNRGVSIGLSEDKERAIIILSIELDDFVNRKRIEAEIIGEFAIVAELDDEKLEEILSVNGVALVYPYVRSIISMVTSLDSDSAIILPTINTNIFDDSQED